MFTLSSGIFIIPILCLKSLNISSVQFIQFHQIHYKSKRPIIYRTSHSAIYIYIYTDAYA